MALEGNDPGDMVDIDEENFDFGVYWIENSSNVGMTGFAEVIADVTDNNTKNRTDVYVEFYGEADYLWTPTGQFDTLGAMLDVHFTYDFEKYPEPGTTTEPVINTTTTTTDPGAELSPGFEFFFTIGSLAILPIIYKRRRH
jgi:hypothetical protein